MLRPTLKLVSDMLKEPSIFSEFAMLRTPSKPLSKNNKIISLFLLLISVTFGLSAVMLNALSIRWVFYMIVGLLLADLIFFTITWSSKSSYIYGNKSIEFADLLETFDAESLCPFCEVIRMPRSRHCNICNRCVERYDHHCPWVNNCIGKTNHLYFYIHLVLLIAYIITIMSSSIYSIVTADEKLPE